MDRTEIRILYDKYCIKDVYQTRHPHLMTFEGFCIAMDSVESLLKEIENIESHKFYKWLGKHGSVNLLESIKAYLKELK